MRPTKYPHLFIVEDLPKETDEFDLLGVWYTKDNRLAVVTDISNSGLMTGMVSRNGRTYECMWDCEQRSVAPFMYIDDLQVKLG